jgi:hypothetical protein
LVVDAPHKTHTIVQCEKQHTEVMQGYEVAAMNDLNNRCSGMGLGQVSVQIKPINDRKVIAEKDFKPEKFKLYGFSTSIVIHTPSNDDGEAK